MKTTKIKMKRVSGMAVLNTSVRSLGKIKISFGDILPDIKNVYDYKKYKPILITPIF